MNDLWHVILTAAISGSASAVGTLIVLRTDMKWIKRIVEDLDERVKFLERSI